MREITTVGVDLAKSIFHVHGNDRFGKSVFKKKLSRKDLSVLAAQLPPCVIGMESSMGSHYWARKFKGFGHTVRIMPSQYVKPYVKTNKNDQIDAEAIAEAVIRPNMRFVPVKSIYQQDIQMVHVIRKRLIGNIVALSNSIRGLLLERGIIMPVGTERLRRLLPDIISDADNELTPISRREVQNLYSEYLDLEMKIKDYDRQIKNFCETDETCLRLLKLPGVGYITASYIKAAVSDPCVFKNGRQFSAWIGLVPRQKSSGGKSNLLGISKRGDIYLRGLLVHGARNIVRYADGKEDRLNRWVQKKHETRGYNKATIAMANKTARLIWAVLRYGDSFKMAS